MLIPSENGHNKEQTIKKIKLINLKFSHELKKKDNDFQIVFTQKNTNNRNITFLNNKETLSGSKTYRKFGISKTVEKLEKDNSMISLYDGTHKKISIHKTNSTAYIKKRPNDLIKSNNLNRSSIVSKYPNNSSIKENGRCFSCTNIKNKANLLNNDNLKRDISFYQDNITSTKKNLFQKVNPFIINDFSFKEKDDFLNKKEIQELNNTILKIVKKRLVSVKALFFQNMKRRMKNQACEVSKGEYKLLEELKSLGVNNKNELNSLLKYIYFGLKGKNKQS